MFLDDSDPRIRAHLVVALSDHAIRVRRDGGLVPLALVVALESLRAAQNSPFRSGVADDAPIPAGRAAALLGISVASLRRAAAAGQIQSAPGRAGRAYLVSELERFGGRYGRGRSEPRFAPLKHVKAINAGRRPGDVALRVTMAHIAELVRQREAINAGTVRLEGSGMDEIRLADGEVARVRRRGEPRTGNPAAMAQAQAQTRATLGYAPAQAAAPSVNSPAARQAQLQAAQVASAQLRAAGRDFDHMPGTGRASVFDRFDYWDKANADAYAKWSAMDAEAIRARSSVGQFPSVTEDVAVSELEAQAERMRDRMLETQRYRASALAEYDELCNPKPLPPRFD